MNCDQAKNLFDAYLDGELSGPLETELAAHRLHCASCRHELALMEVAGHVISADADPSHRLDDGFTDRLLACIETGPDGSVHSANRRWWIGGSALAAAAAIVIVCTMWLYNPGGRVAGERAFNPALPAEKSSVQIDEADLSQAADSIVRQVESTWTERADGAQSLIEFGQMTIMQTLDRLGIDEPAEPAEGFEPLPDSFDELAPKDTTNDDIEDL